MYIRINYMNGPVVYVEVYSIKTSKKQSQAFKLLLFTQLDLKINNVEMC